MPSNRLQQQTSLLGTLEDFLAARQENLIHHRRGAGETSPGEGSLHAPRYAICMCSIQLEASYAKADP